MVGNLACQRAMQNALEPDERFLALNVNYASLAPVVPDGRVLTAFGSVAHRRGDVIIANAEVRDQDGQIVGLVNGPCLVAKRNRPSQRASDRALLTVLFTDLVGSTERAAQLGDVAWSRLLDQHNEAITRQLEIHNGRKIKSTGDGVLAVFSSPSRAVLCARAIRDALAKLDLQTRAGLHVGECEIVGADVAGLVVHVAARIQGAAEPGEILVSTAVRELITDSGVKVVEAGDHQLRGLEGSYMLYVVTDDPA
jgi:class 3 adenylate cyclase